MPQSPVVLLWGEDAFLLREAALEVIESRGFRATEVDASEWRGGETSDLATPSLLGEPRALLVTGVQALPDQGVQELRAYLASPAPEALCVLTLVSRSKGPPPLAREVTAAGGSVRQVGVKRQDLPKWVVGRAQARGLRLTGPGAAALVERVGEDPAALDQAVEQLGAAFPGQDVGPGEVRAQFQGLGEQRVWDLCDQALSGRVGEALVTLRSLFEQRADPLLVLGGIAARVRDLLRVAALPTHLPPAEVARASGLRFDWQARRYREQAQRLGRDRLVDLHARVVEADRALKGGIPADVVLPVLVAALAGEAGAALSVPARPAR